MIGKLFNMVSDKTRELLLDVGLLVARVGLGGFMAAAHGWPKFEKVIAGIQGKSEGKAFLENFPDPLGVGHAFSAISAAGTEFICAILLAVGIATRFNAVVLAFTMYVAAFLHHKEDPFAAKELALVYLVGFVVLALTGPGRFSLDQLLRKRLG